MNSDKIATLNMIGKTFERLTVLSIHHRDNHRQFIISCQCSCGTIVEKRAQNIRRGLTRSCGCLNRELSASRRTKHGGTHTRLFNTWNGMKQRCGNPNHQAYRDYGGRGITVCTQWLDSFSAFREWAIANGYRNDLTIDRIENDKGYEPGNCQWLTRSANSSKAHKGKKWRKNQ